MSFVPPEDIPAWIPVCAVLWLLASTWKGWSRGLVRQAVSLVALMAAVAAGFYIGPLLAPALPAIGFPRFLRPLVAGILVAFLIWGAVTSVSAIVFRRTDEQGVGVVRAFYGLSGAVLGLISGLLLLGLGAWGVRLAGSLADGLQTGALAKPLKKGQSPPPTAPDPSPLAALKKTVEESPLSSWLSKVDPISPDWYPRLSKIGQALTSQSARERLLSDPSFAPIAKNPRLAALRDDPALQEALRAADLWTLLRSPKVQAAAADTQLLTALRPAEVDLALERALRPQSPLPESRPSEPRRAKP
jgi:hypothetical protein